MPTVAKTTVFREKFSSYLSLSLPSFVLFYVFYIVLFFVLVFQSNENSVFRIYSKFYGFSSFHGIYSYFRSDPLREIFTLHRVSVSTEKCQLKNERDVKVWNSIWMWENMRSGKSTNILDVLTSRRRTRYWNQLAPNAAASVAAGGAQAAAAHSIWSTTVRSVRSVRSYLLFNHLRVRVEAWVCLYIVFLCTK